MTAPVTVSKSEACEMLGVSAAAFNDWRRKGILPEPIAGTRRWTRQSLLRALGVGLDSPAKSEADRLLEEWERAEAS